MKMDNKLSNGQPGSIHFCNGHDSLCDEESFVVLSNPSGQFTSPGTNISPSHRTNSISASRPTLPNITVPMKSPLVESSHCSLVTGSFASDVSPEEIQKKLNELLQENVTLKETLYQNNLAMKQQLTTLGTWQAEVAKLHQTHKEKFSETRELILKLRTENDELKKALKDANLRTNRNVLNTVDGTLMAENASLVKQVEELRNQVSALTSAKTEQQVFKSGTTKKEQELISLTEQLNRQLEIAERSRRQLGVDVERLQAQKTRLEREMTPIRSDLEAHKESAKYAETEIQKLQHMCTSREKEIDYLKANLRDQEGIIGELKTQKEQVLQQTPNSDVKTSLDTQQKLVELGDSLEKQASMYSDMYSWVSSTAGQINKLDSGASGDSATIEELQNKVKEVQKMLEDEQALGKERVKIITEAQEQFRCLFEQYQDAVKRLEESKKNSDNDAHRNSYYEVQVRGFTEKIDCMTAQVMKLEDDVTQRNHKIAVLETRIKEIELENESIPILQLQMEVYQSDFNAEREARENMAGEKEHLAEDLRLLQQRNQRLLSELKLYQQNYGEQLQNFSSGTSNNGWTTIATPQRNHPRENTPPSPGPFGGN